MAKHVARPNARTIRARLMGFCAQVAIRRVVDRLIDCIDWDELRGLIVSKAFLIINLVPWGELWNLTVTIATFLMGG